MSNEAIQLSIWEQFGVEAQIEKTEPVFQAEKFDLEPKYTVFRIDGGESRFYFTLDDTYEPSYYISVTSLIQATTPMPYGLKVWLADKGWEQSRAILNERAQYGTWMHMLCNELLINGSIDLSTDDFLKEHLFRYVNSQEKDLSSRQWIKDIKSDLMAFTQFVQDHNVEPLLIEQALAHPSGYAGAIDLVCKMDYEVKGFHGEYLKSGVNKGQPKETKKTFRGICIVDYKSGRKGFYESHEIQLKAYENLVEHNYGVSVDRLYNWAPTDWRMTPDYKLKDQTNSDHAKLFPFLLDIAKQKKELLRPPMYRKCSGVLDINKPLDGLYSEIDPDDIARHMRGFMSLEDDEAVEEAQEAVLTVA